MAKTRTVTLDERDTIAASIGQLKTIRDNLRRAGAANSASYVQRAVKSVEGALRHADRVLHEQQQREIYQLYEATGDERLRGVM